MPVGNFMDFVILSGARLWIYYRVFVRKEEQFS